jgi:hypothetical protein
MREGLGEVLSLSLAPRFMLIEGVDYDICMNLKTKRKTLRLR